MKSLSEFEDYCQLESGTLLRVFKVHRMDVMKLAEDRDCVEKRANDYYDMIFFDSDVIRPDTYTLMNDTRNCMHRGHVYWVADVKDRHAFEARVLKEYFHGTEFEVYVLE